MKQAPLQWMVTVAAILVFIAVAWMIVNSMREGARVPVVIESHPVQYPDVSVVRAKAGTHGAVVRAYGAVSPRFSLDLTAEISGLVESLGEDCEPGKRVAKGTLLVSVEDSEYRSAVALAQKELADSRIALLEEEGRSRQAEAEWSSSDLQGAPDSELVLRAPQLAAALAAVASAEAALAKAGRELERTEIRAPFDAIVVERSIAPGSYLQSGSQIAVLYSTDRADIRIHLASEEWAMLPESRVVNSGLWPVQVWHAQSGEAWDGRILRLEQHANSHTRQRALIVAVDAPLDREPPLLAGSFVNMVIPGVELGNLWCLPPSSLSQNGEIWYVTEDQLLRSFDSNIIFSDDKGIYIAAPESLAGEEQQILVRPLSSYVQGMKVNPVEVKGHE
ncbi:efflux RND transporter periplasmic adaptor subunit [Desulfobotulus sp. H1]|uniref:Efflux RND transporter periplasmic adaptor subunit n=1 Tax=Desulfobotulus pelophilus TaxID=2823377 RepID=A0ABT3N6D8_9BACT|nr:efflux RND transporter periplasmic adaptor subunit [Desulfobotulus pelophilus]MCW7753012.1 efflux RND transporter periplasmic adaptor subunit [Desulfobotulus pelophilus]